MASTPATAPGNCASFAGEAAVANSRGTNSTAPAVPAWKAATKICVVCGVQRGGSGCRLNSATPYEASTVRTALTISSRAMKPTCISLSRARASATKVK